MIAKANGGILSFIGLTLVIVGLVFGLFAWGMASVKDDVRDVKGSVADVKATYETKEAAAAKYGAVLRELDGISGKLDTLLKLERR